MHKKDCFYLGKIVGKHSFKGELLIKLDTDDPENYTKMESVFVEMNKSLIPFFIKKSNLQKSQLLRVRFEDVDDEETAEALLRCAVYLPMEQLPALDDDQFYYHEIIGFRTEDKDKNFIGTIKGVNDRGPQALFEIDRNGKEVLVPVIDEFIHKLDKPQRTLVFDLPEGFLEMF